ncbi:recombinase family protein [Streptomyces aurantiacus]|uniref:recombinase family protein n=1 Tax=Streptomyces aurantiacus TaxID=47760 RepID=UPI0006E1A46C|nr:recombinase family protein [Streptomyces aurantiacus]
MDAARAAGRWTASSVREVLTNPKYTGHMVWNRRTRKGAGHNSLNPAEEWVWSNAPAHGALVGLETFVRAQQVAERRRRRIQGKPSERAVYYVCPPKAEYRSEGYGAHGP